MDVFGNEQFFIHRKLDMTYTDMPNDEIQVEGREAHVSSRLLVIVIASYGHRATYLYSYSSSENR